jgi:hypothetical protein
VEWAGGGLARPGRKERRGEEGGLGQERKRERKENFLFFSFLTQTSFEQIHFEFKHKI